jgi:hypothetical protein
MKKLAGAATLAVLAVLAGGCIGAEVGPGGAEAGVGVGPFKVIKAEAGPSGGEIGAGTGPAQVLKDD